VDLKYAKNALAAGAPPRNPLGSSGRSPRPLVGWEGGHPLPIPTPSAPLAPRFSRLWRFDPRAPRGSLVPRCYGPAYYGMRPLRSLVSSVLGHDFGHRPNWLSHFGP